MAAEIIAVCLGTALISAAFARILNIPAVYRWYHPDNTWITVAIGDGIIIGGALLVLWVRGILPGMAVLCYYAVLFAAGVPIIIWQEGQRRERRRTLEQAVAEREERRRQWD